MINPDNRPRPKPFDLLASLAAFAHARGIALTDPELIPTFTADAGEQLAAALDDEALLHGTRTERLFEATVLSLGRFRLFKTEDSGRVHSAETMRVPDFRVVLEDGDQWLIEVKNVRCSDPFRQRTGMSAAYLHSLRSYADAMGVPLRLAFYWSVWNIWTVIAPEPFMRKDGSLRVRMQDAVAVSEFGRLGEVTIMTIPPLRIVLRAAPDRPRGLEGYTASFIVGSVEIFADGKRLVDARDRKLAEVLIFYGEWTLAGPFALMEEGEIAGVEYVAEPEEPAGEGWQGIGWASRIFSRYFATQTVEGERLIQLHGRPAPDWFAPLDRWDFAGSNLRLLLGHIEPNFEIIRNGTARGEG
ncbi:hypothetical protein [Sphingomonas sp. CFBP 13733]|uniref:hypothetical protein n=1 Tax=Sphingomonas sp. CFBP 13733 TaxID=2775291 RepID=UPI0017849245|nr:hypothetical protein [Sphingomonas sp. CFBP 13733]MBD8640256.1 hypothetical protein [Sphingomonas sp. CFBP 13733]